MRSSIQCPNIVIANGGTVSTAVIDELSFGDAELLTIQSPAVLAEAATIQISNDFDVNYAKNGLTLAAATAAATWADLVDLTGTAVALGGAGEAVMLDNFPCAAWRIKVASAAAAEHTFKIYKLVSC
jgi:hypothetical protein